MGEIRIVGPGKTRGFPYPVCKKMSYILGHYHKLNNKRSAGTWNISGKSAC